MTIINLHDQAVKHAFNKRSEQQILLRSQSEAAVADIKYSGSLGPEEAWKLFTRGVAHLVDIRHKKDRYLYGHVPNTFHVAWCEEGTVNDQFSTRLAKKLSRDSIIMLLNSQGSDDEVTLAAQKATEDGFTHVYVVKEGYENQSYAEVINSEQYGWRSRGLPWVAGQE